MIALRVSARAEISTRLTGLKFCSDYGLQPGLKLLASATNMKWRAKSLRRIKMAPRTRMMKIGTLLLSQFGLLVALNFQLLWMVTAYKMIELKRNLSLAAYLSARKTYCKEREDIFKLAEFMVFLTASYCLNLSAMKSMFSYSI